MLSVRRGVTYRALAVGAAAVTGLTVIGVQGAQAGQVAKAPPPLVTYNNNIENMVPHSCSGDRFDRLLNYLKSRPKSPDVFTVQQISNTRQLTDFTKRLSDLLPGTYAGRIAIGSPGSMGYTSRCGKLKNQQTNAVIYRTDRLVPKSSTTWRSDAPKGGSGPCRNLTPTKTSQDRVQNIAVRFQDKSAGRDVTVASIHWPTKKWNGPDCASENIKEANEAVDRLGGSLKIVAGDANVAVSHGSWWNKARGYGFRDPIAEKCGSRDCSTKHNTCGKRRIDVMLVKHTGGFSNAATITDSMTGGSYSNHKAVTAYVKY
ncbi:hypothetical protein [Streptomyces sp. NPDC058045]|uniref:hypothetical protein n=1 Tax=Streptomyces sp. NPDC058045 TaxID=3346311 RepID=UPI0036ED43F0